MFESNGYHKEDREHAYSITCSRPTLCCGCGKWMQSGDNAVVPKQGEARYTYCWNCGKNKF